MTIKNPDLKTLNPNIIILSDQINSVDAIAEGGNSQEEINLNNKTLLNNKANSNDVYLKKQTYSNIEIDSKLNKKSNSDGSTNFPKLILNNQEITSWPEGVIPPSGNIIDNSTEFPENGINPKLIQIQKNKDNILKSNQELVIYEDEDNKSSGEISLTLTESIFNYFFINIKDKNDENGISQIATAHTSSVKEGDGYVL